MRPHVLSVALMAAYFLSRSLEAAGTNLGTEFWLGFPANCGSCGGPGSIVLTVFIASAVDNSGTVEVPGLGINIPYTVTGGSIASVNLPDTVLMGYPGSGVDVEILEMKGVHVTALSEVSVYGLNRRFATTDAYLGLPVSAVGTDYVLMGWGAGVLGGSELGVVATEDGTIVTITPSVTTVGHAAGVPYTVSLSEGQTYFLACFVNTTNDLTGSLIQSNHPVSVFGGHYCGDVPNPPTGGCDHLVEQNFPTPSWGNAFVTIPLATRSGGDTFRVLASVDGTQVTLNGSPVATLSRGQFYEAILPSASVITSDQPVSVAQYANGGIYDGNGSADPFMALVPPVAQFQDAYLVTTALVGIAANYLNLAVPASAVGMVLLDGSAVPAGSFSPIGSSGYSGAQVAVSVGSHALSGPAPFGVLAYGFDYAESYGYPGGGDLADSPTATFSPSPLVSPTPTCTVTGTPSPSPSDTLTVSPTATFSMTMTVTPTVTPTATASVTTTVTPSVTATGTITRTFTHTPTASATFTASPTLTATPLPLCLVLHGNNPNPGGDDGTYLSYSLCAASTVKVRLYTLSGEVVRDLEPFEAQAGNQEQFWDCRNSHRLKVASGVFIYRVEAVSARGETASAFGKCAVLR